MHVWLRIILWAALTAAGAAVVSAKLDVRSDLRLFLPQAGNAQERILLEELKEGPGTRLMLVALSGAPPAKLAQVSERLADELRRAEAQRPGKGRLFTQVENGTLHAEPRLQELVFKYRYLLTPRPGGCACDAPNDARSSLHEELQNRLMELASPAGMVAEDLLLRDPSGEMQAILDEWIPPKQPQLIDGVWFSADGQRALLLLQTAAAGFDADGQHAALSALIAALHGADPSGKVQFQATGPGAFTALLEETVRGDVNLLGVVEGIGSFLFLLFVLRSFKHVVLGSLTLATAGVTALLSMMLLYPSVHGITLAFGFTLLGVAMDYPVHLILHLDGRHSPRATLQHVWPTLRLSIATTCIAYFALVFGGFTGLAQLGTFTVCGLIATALLIRWWVPGLLSPEAHRPVPQWVGKIDRVPHLPWLPAVTIPVALAVLVFSPHPLWNNELSGLTPVPQELLALDAKLREDIAAPDLRYLLAIRATEVEGALQRDEDLRGALDALVGQGVIGGYEQPSRLLPSVRTQREQQRRLPSERQLRANLRMALQGLPFKPDAFEGFIADVTASRQLRPLQLADLAGTSLAERLSATLLQSGKQVVALVSFSDVRDPARLEAWARAPGGAKLGDARHEHVVLIDLKSTSEQLVDRFRDRALAALGVALVLIGALMLASLPWQAVLAVLLPVVATLLSVVAIFNAAGIALTLFHIVSLLLVGGLCFDYGLFFNRSEASDEESLRTRLAVMVCWVSTTGAFALLLISQLPVLRAIGSTVAGGVTVGFFLALLGRRPEPPPHH
jgi:predicted exporter